MDVNVEEVFERAFCDITERLVCLKVERSPVYPEKDYLNEDTVHEYIKTSGFLKGNIICEFSESLFKYIIETMSRSENLPKDEAVLYLNEYMNIICGRAVSEINDITGRLSRLSVPWFYKRGEKPEICCTLKNSKEISYYTKEGFFNVILSYSFEECREEEV